VLPALRWESNPNSRHAGCWVMGDAGEEVLIFRGREFEVLDDRPE
jgi:hypothetical protein